MSLLLKISNRGSSGGTTSGGGGGGGGGGTMWTGNVAFVGDSYVAGYGLSPTSDRWPTKLIGIKGGTENNYGQSGTVIQSGTCRTAYDTSVIPAYDSSWSAILIALSLNDVGVNTAVTTPAHYQAALEGLLDLVITTKGWPAAKVYVMSPAWVPQAGRDAYLGECGGVAARTEAGHDLMAAAALAAATAKGAVPVDSYTAVKNEPTNNTFMQADHYHYNATGHLFLANYLHSVI